MAARTTRWAVTLTATAVSTYALDAIATAAGIALVATGALDGVERGPLLALLVATYVLWAAGLASNLAANWLLLEQTGTSSNAFSKAAYDVTAARTLSVRGRRTAATIGYVATEAVKEVPYYLGAFGAALTEPVTANDALIFLAGTNVGAAAYEYGLSRCTHAFLHARARPN